jgi:hypothetical protein
MVNGHSKTGCKNRLQTQTARLPGNEKNNEKTTKKALNSQELRASYRGGEGGIRTRGKFYPSYAFQAYDLNRSSTSPSGMYCSLGQWLFRSNDSSALKLVAAYAVNTWTIGRKAFKNVLLKHSESRYVLLGIGGHDLGNTEASAGRPLGQSLVVR